MERASFGDNPARWVRLSVVVRCAPHLSDGCGTRSSGIRAVNARDQARKLQDGVYTVCVGVWVWGSSPDCQSMIRLVSRGERGSAVIERPCVTLLLHVYRCTILHGLSMAALMSVPQSASGC